LDGRLRRPALYEAALMLRRLFVAELNVHK